MRSLAHAIVRSLESGQALELVTVLTASGSTPRGPGAMLAVFSDGTAVGTVGGGNVEFEATAVAKSLLQSQQDALREFRLIQGDAASLGMVCGGDLTLHFQYLSADDASTLALFRELLEATGQNRDVWLVRRLDNGKSLPWTLRTGMVPGISRASHWTCWRMLLPCGTAGLPCRQCGRASSISLAGGTSLRRWCPWPPRWDSVPSFTDDRPEFAAKARFPQAAGTLCGSLPPSPGT
ncbi:MAG: XdhC family protein [Oscillospiraceae bacterium]